MKAQKKSAPKEAKTKKAGKKLPQKVLEKNPQSVPNQAIMPSPKEMQVEIRSRKIESFEGPIPPPAIVEGYEKIITGGADRILKLAEKEQRHRHQWDDKALNIEGQMTSLGLKSGAVLATAGIVGGTVCGLFGEPWVAPIIVGAPFTGYIIKFMTSKFGS